MTTILASTILVAAAVIFGAKLFKAHLDRYYPSLDDDGEIEEFLAARLERDLSKPGSLSPLLIDG
jgi:hypothetical protein